VNREQLAHRAEQALLGGLMAGGDHGSVRAIVAGDFTDPRHQAIFLAVTGQAREASWPAALGDRLGRAGRHAAEAAAYMEQLPGRCPDPRHLGHYAAMVTARQQQAAGAAGQLASAGAELDRMTARGRRAALPAEVAPGVARLARVLRPVVVARFAEWRQAAHRRLAGLGSVEGAPGHMRDLVLASLLHHPADGLGFAARVDPGELFDASRQRLYELVRARLAARQDTDALIIAWEATQASQRDGVPAVAQLALAFGDVKVMAGTARVLGRALLADAVLTEAIGAEWTRVPGITSRLQLRSDTGPAAQPQAGPAAAQSPAHYTQRQVVAGMSSSLAQGPRPPEPGNGIVPRA
jgi:hypothetical protein